MAISSRNDEEKAGAFTFQDVLNVWNLFASNESFQEKHPGASFEALQMKSLIRDYFSYIMGSVDKKFSVRLLVSRMNQLYLLPTTTDEEAACLKKWDNAMVSQIEDNPFKKLIEECAEGFEKEQDPVEIFCLQLTANQLVLKAESKQVAVPSKIKAGRYHLKMNTWDAELMDKKYFSSSLYFLEYVKNIGSLERDAEVVFGVAVFKSLDEFFSTEENILAFKNNFDLISHALLQCVRCWYEYGRFKDFCSLEMLSLLALLESLYVFQFSEKKITDFINKLHQEIKFSLFDQDSNGETLLIIAAKKGFVNVVKLLKKEASLVNVRNNYDETALLGASYFRHGAVVKQLIAVGADPNVESKNGITALHSACYYGDEEIARDLILSGAEINKKNNNGETPLDLAIRKKQSNVVMLLLSFNATVKNVEMRSFLGEKFGYACGVYAEQQGRDKNFVIEQFQFSADRGYLPACVRVASLYQQAGNVEKAFYYAKKAMDGNAIYADFYRQLLVEKQPVMQRFISYVSMSLFAVCMAEKNQGEKDDARTLDAPRLISKGL